MCALVCVLSKQDLHSSLTNVCYRVMMMMVVCEEVVVVLKAASGLDVKILGN